MKKFWNTLKQKMQNFWQYAKVFLSNWQNWAFLASVILSIVFLCMWNVADWCKVAGFGALCFTMLCFALIFTNFFINFNRLINKQKQEILEGLAKQFQKEEYLQLKTPFNETDEQRIQYQIKRYRNVMIFFWILFVLCVYVFITLLFQK